tara:strand:+ start:417 stop:626 length:210 start_codon:yes stop_codon:yes gene_type:complete
MQKDLLLKAAMAHYKAKQAEALAVLDVYFKSSVGVADHSELLDEVKKWTAVLTESEENLATLSKHYGDE